MAVIETLQNVLDSMGAMRNVVVHLNSGVSDVIIQEALALMVKMLYAGNSQVQVWNAPGQLHRIVIFT